MNATAQKLTVDPPPRARFAAFSLGRLETKIVSSSLHLALRYVKDKNRNAGYKIEFTRAGSPGRSNCDPLFTVIKYGGTLEQLRDPGQCNGSDLERDSNVATWRTDPLTTRSRAGQVGGQDRCREPGWNGCVGAGR